MNCSRAQTLPALARATLLYLLLSWPAVALISSVALLITSAPAHSAQTVSQALDLKSIQRRNLRFSYLNTEHGLSQNSILDITQDHQGYIWIGTQEGLNRYDGHDIVLFERDAFDSTSLSHNWVWALMVDNKGELWVGTDGGGINIYDNETETFRTIRHNPKDDQSISSDRTSALFQDTNGNYWVGTVNSGLNKIDGETGKVTRYISEDDHPDSLPHNSILTIYEDTRNRLWIGTDGGGLARYDRSTNTFVRHQRSESEHSLSHNTVAAILEDRGGKQLTRRY